MRYSATYISCAVLLLGISFGCDVATPHNSPQPVQFSQTEPVLSDATNRDGIATSAQPKNELFTLVSNNGSSKKSPTPALKTPRSQSPKAQSPIQNTLPTPLAKAAQGTADPSHTEPTLKKQEKFQPPFAERTNVFTPPNSEQSVPVKEGEQSVAIAPVLDVSLKGFAKVDNLRAILMIEDTIAPLAMGQEKQGIRIISIEPPKVTLERDEQRWTLTLSNQFPRSGNDPSRRSIRD